MGSSNELWQQLQIHSPTEWWSLWIFPVVINRTQNGHCKLFRMSLWGLFCSHMKQRRMVTSSSRELLFLYSNLFFSVYYYGYSLMGPGGHIGGDVTVESISCKSEKGHNRKTLTRNFFSHEDKLECFALTLYNQLLYKINDRWGKSGILWSYVDGNNTVNTI